MVSKWAIHSVLLDLNVQLLCFALQSFNTNPIIELTLLFPVPVALLDTASFRLSGLCSSCLRPPVKRKRMELSEIVNEENSVGLKNTYYLKELVHEALELLLLEQEIEMYIVLAIIIIHFVTSRSSKILRRRFAF